jgi:hypothetical protein
MTLELTEFRRWALSLRVPWLAWPALENPSDLELLKRADLLAWDFDRDGDAELINILTEFGCLQYLEAEHVRN